MSLVQTLVRHRYVVYLGGLAVITAPPALEAAGILVSQSVRTALVAVALAAMVVTYIGERRLRSTGETDDASAPADVETPDTAAQVAVAAALGGIAVGGYLGLQGRLWIGGLFAIGAVAFGRMAIARTVDGDVE